MNDEQVEALRTKYGFNRIGIIEGEMYLPIKDVFEKLVQRWIPCSERLPEIYDTYLVVVKLKYEWETEWEYHTDVADFTFEEGYIEGWDTFNDWDEGQECHVIAWMPLPEPYKEEGEGHE